MSEPRAAAVFDALAEAYGTYRLGYADEVYEVLAESGGILPGARVVDVGCGTGLVSAELVRRGCAVTGVDASSAMLVRARAREPRATFLLARAESLPFPDAAFDAATSAQAFHWFDQPRVLAELARVVRPGGIVAIWWKLMMRGDASRMIREEVARELGLEPPPDLLGDGFPAFEQAPLLDPRLRVIPWVVEMTVADFLGYEASRARARAAYGARLPDYLARLGERLGEASTVLSIGYIHFLYLGRVAGPRGA